MAKFTFEDKSNIVLGYVNGQFSQTEYARQVRVTKAQLQYWLRLYELHGTEGLKSTYSNYSKGFKLDVLNFMAQSGASLMDTAATFMIPSFTTVYEWKRKLETGDLDALEPKKKGRLSMKKKQSKTN